jgi:hypothetical protein
MAESVGEDPRGESAGTQLFPYGRRLAPMLWALVALAAIEIGVVHLLLWHWSRALALTLGGVSAAALIWIVALILSFRARPVEVGPRGVRVRTGFVIDSDIAYGEIAFVQSGYASADYMPGSLLKASLLAYPNAVLLLRRDIDLAGAFGRKRRVHAVALAVDEPSRFLAAVERRLNAPTAEDRRAG